MSAVRGARLPDEWTLPDGWRAWALGYVCPYTGQRLAPAQVALEAEKFADHFWSAPGQKGVKRNWQATWRNWVRTAAREKHPGRRGDGGEDLLSEACALGVSTLGKSEFELRADIEAKRRRRWAG